LSRSKSITIPRRDDSHLPLIIAAAIEESQRTQGMTANQYFDYVRTEDPNAIVPPMVDGAYMTPAEHEAVGRWASTVREIHVDIKSAADEGSWRRMVETAYVAVETEIRTQEDGYPTADAMSERLLTRSREILQSSLRPITHYIPCNLINDHRPEPLQIGPVEFIPGTLLVERITTTLGAQPKWLEEYIKLRDGIAPDDLPSSRARWSALDAFEMSKAPWLAVVTVADFEPQMSRRRANDAARLAIATFALPFLHPSTVSSVGLVYEWGKPSVARTLGQLSGGDIFGGSTKNLPQARLAASIKEIISEQRDYLQWCGNAITECITGAATPRQLREYWLNALHWYYAGCIEPSDARGVICFSTTLESLAAGVGADAIVELLEVLLKTDRHKVIAPLMGWSLEQSIAEIYSGGRSEVVHGGRFVVFKEYRRIRDIAAELCRHALLVARDRLSEYELATARRAEGDSKKSFLKWLKART
jgi:hypothetical protein